MKLLVLRWVVEDKVENERDRANNDTKVVAPSPSSSSMEDEESCDGRTEDGEWK